MNTVADHRGIAIPRFIDSCVVGVNECGSRPRMFVEPMNIIRDLSIREPGWPFWICFAFCCLDDSFINPY